jgi:hypothetical protein
MNRMIGPASSILVGATFICLCMLLTAAASENPSNLPDLQSELKVSQSQSLDHNPVPYIVQPENAKETISFPGALGHGSGLRLPSSNLMPRSLPSEEKTVLDSSHPAKQVSDLKAVNSIKQRDIVYGETQNGNPDAIGLVDSLDVSVTGPSQVENDWSVMIGVEDNFEKKVDAALWGMKNEEKNGQTSERYPMSKRLSNNMNIDVSGITVSAINTVEGGSAVATSNIIIKPVQIIVCPSEVGEKLK